MCAKTRLRYQPGLVKKDKRNMNKKISLLAAGMFLAALVPGFGEPVITSQPQSVTNLAGTTATFFVRTRTIAIGHRFNITIAMLVTGLCGRSFCPPTWD